MQNIRKTAATTRRRGPALPVVSNMDDLATMVDEELTRRFRELDTDMLAAAKANVDTTPWTTELAYIRREQLIRRARREAHELYLQETASSPSEDDFEPADLDNSAFLLISRRS